MRVYIYPDIKDDDVTLSYLFARLNSFCTYYILVAHET